MTDDRVRHLMFFPDEEDMDYYPLLISSPPDNVPDDYPQVFFFSYDVEISTNSIFSNFIFKTCK